MGMVSSLHMDETVFENPTSFQYDRFLPNKVFTKQDGKVLSNPVRAFGGGTTMCPGRKFARIEIKAFVAELLYRYEFELVLKPGGAGDDTPRIDSSRSGLGINVP